MHQLTTHIIVIELIGSGDRTPRIKQLTPSAATFLDYSVNELIGQPIDILYATGNDKALWQTALASITDNNARLDPSAPLGTSFVTEIATKSDNKVQVLLSLSVLSNRTPNKTDIILLIQPPPDGADGLGLSAELALTESEERFRQMAEITGEWLWEQNPEGYYSYSSTAITQILGYSPNDVLGKHYTEFLAPQDKADQQRYATSHRPFYALLSHYRHKDGRQILTESTGLPIINAGGKLLKWRGVDRDITAKTHFQDALIESERRTRLIIESSLNAIVIMDSYGIINDWNHPAEKMFGWTKDEAIGQRLEDLIIPPRFRDAHRQGLEQFLRTGFGPLLNQLLEQTAMRRDGTEFPVELSFSPLKQGNTYIFSGFIHDISNRKAAEQQIRQAQINLAIAQSEIRIAQRIQASLSPSAPIKSAHFEVTGFCLPADRIGGDYFDYFYRNEDHLDMIIADVSGHSIGPALFMVETRSAIRTQANGLGTPAETLTLLNNFLFEDLDKSDYFITLFYLQYNISKQRLRFANAGHPPPLLLSPCQSECRQLDADGLILGVNKNVVFEEKTVTLSQGDLILLYTDGLTEAENANGEFFGLKRVSDILVQHAQQSPQTIINVLLEQLKLFCCTESFNDDITLMVFKRY
ncbi:MAG: PAS domain S-box protein [Methylobacter sp.]|nr:MAG: PAS domain S-box protein [Methylobacter sp.]